MENQTWLWMHLNNDKLLLVNDKMDNIIKTHFNKFINIFLPVVVSIAFFSCKQNNPIIPPYVPPVVQTADFAKGADVSWVTQMEASNKLFYNAAGTQMECMALLKSLGMNSIRLRVWVNPADGWCNSQDLLIKALRAKNLGMRLMIDFHYSDSWADPGKQTKPAAWVNLNYTDLKTAVSTHTKEVLNLLKTNNITPEWIQIGNETGNGMLWPDGKASINMANYATLNNLGYNAVKSIFPNAKVIVHINNGYDNSLFHWIFDGLVANGAKWDVIGMSVYPYWFTPSNDWQTCNQQCLINMNDMVSRYGKEVMIVECGMAWDSPTVCQSFLNDLITKTKSITGGKGIGVFYWEPEAYGQWQKYPMGAFDDSGKPTVALDAFK
jgi:arabinogalactan endo-1,4-beta-galactosidase